MRSMFLRLAALCAGSALSASCALNTAATPAQYRSETIHPAITGRLSSAGRAALQTPALIAADGDTGVLEYWPIAPHGGSHPTPISKPLGIGSSFGLAANGRVVAAAEQNPPAVVIYNLTTQHKAVLADPFGIPFDIAIDKNANLFVINSARPDNVTMFAPGAPPRELQCAAIYIAAGIAADNEGDVFVSGYSKTSNGEDVVEIPNGPNGPQPQNCSELNIGRGSGYSAGLAVDPKTDALIVLDNPDLCAGGIEGRMRIYPKPYRPKTAVTHDVGLNCSGGIRLNADSTRVFVGDQDVSGSYTFVLQRSYPDGASMGSYNDGQPVGITTIPNVLPN